RSSAERHEGRQECHQNDGDDLDTHCQLRASVGFDPVKWSPCWGPGSSGGRTGVTITGRGNGSGGGGGGGGGCSAAGFGCSIRGVGSASTTGSGSASDSGGGGGSGSGVGSPGRRV